MRLIITFMITAFFSICITAAPVCTVDENGHYSCSFELPDTESVEREYKEGTFEIIIGSKDKNDKFFIDTLKSLVFFEDKRVILDKDDVEEILELLYSQEKDIKNSICYLKVFSSNYGEFYLKINRSKKETIFNKIEKIIKKGKTDL